MLDLLLTNFLQPPPPVHFPHTQKQHITHYLQTQKHQTPKSIPDTFLHIVPTNFFQSFPQPHFLPIIFFTLLFPLPLSPIPQPPKP
ncbi:cation:dicarboxylate symporter family transporter, partial [Bacillus pumilus]|uniref:cation:dicarboxylate symporter family transporter n=1 Tax=Bacillus pumilus TaxID=1408 RepID=UPI0011A50068